MGIENFKRPHWIVLGILAGLALGYVWSSLGTGVEQVRTADRREFERDLMLKDDKTGSPLVKNIVIHPAEDTYDGKKLSYVTYQRLSKDKQDRRWWTQKKVEAFDPYIPAIPGRVEDVSGLTIEKYLAAVTRQNPGVGFHYGWWLLPQYAMALGAAAGLVLIGGLWPTALNLLVGSGFTKPPVPKVEKSQAEKLKWFKRADRPKPVASAASVKASDEEMADLAAAYEKNLAGAGVEITPGDDAESAAALATAEPSIRKLETHAVEPAAITKPVEEDDIEVKGEFYPVLIHHKKEAGAAPRQDPK